MNSPRSGLNVWALILLLSVLYFIAGKLGLALAFVNASATAIWPPTGISLAILLIFGFRVWPAILIGAFCVNLATSGNIPVSFGIALGNTLEGILGAYLIQRFAKGRDCFNLPPDLFRFVLLAAGLSTTLSASIGTTTLALYGLASWSNFGSIWFTWWMGDMGGALVVTPLLILWSSKTSLAWNSSRIREAILLLISLVAVTAIVFSSGLFPSSKHYPLDFLCLITVLWAAFRFGQRETAAVTLLLSIMSVIATLRGDGPFVMATPNESLLILQAFLGVLSITGLAVAGAVAQGQRVERARRIDEQERNKLLESERSARNEAERLNRIKDEFLANLSHELRTPLNSILGWVYLLRKGKLAGEAQMQGIDGIERSTRIQAQLISDLLDMSRIVAGKLRLDIKPVDLEAVISAAVEVLQPAANAKQITIERILEPKIFTSGDVSRLQQIVWNLLSNAIKFSSENSKIRVLLTKSGERAEITVSDSGQGIDPQFLPTIFERFTQADASSTRKFGGLGIGLSIVKELAELHLGTVRAASPGLGRGASFTLSLPLNVLPLAEEKREEAAARNGVQAVEQAQIKLPGLKILVVDDEADTRTILKRILENCQAEVFVAASVDEGMKVFKLRRPALLISDIGMPVRDGYEFIRQIRELSPEDGGRVPAIALTAFARLEDQERALSCGYQLHMQKPFEASILIARVAELSRSSRLSEV